jgi:hypothetical protein
LGEFEICRKTSEQHETARDSILSILLILSKPLASPPAGSTKQEGHAGPTPNPDAELARTKGVQ